MKLSSALLCMLIAACAGVPPDAGQNVENHDSDIEPGTITLTLSPTSVQLAPGGSATVAVSIERDDTLAGTDVDLISSAAPDGVTVTFDSPRTTAGTVNMVLSAAADASSASTSITVTATSGTVSAGAALAVVVGTPSTITVNGKYLSAEGTSVSPRAVKLWSQGASTPLTATTAADGSFSISGVTPPYDVMVIGTEEKLLALGLTRTDPVLADTFNHEQVSTGVELGVQLSGARYSGGSDTYGWYTDATAECGAGKGIDTGAADIEVNGVIADGTSCTVQAFQYEPFDSGFLAHHLSTGQLTQTVNNGQAYVLPMAMTERAAHTTTYEGTFHDGSTYIGITSEWWLPQPDIAVFIYEADMVSKTAGPTDTGIVLSLVFNDKNDDNTRASITKVMGSATDITFQTPAHPKISKPVKDALLKPTSQLTFSGTAGAVNQVLFECENNPDIVLITPSTSMDLSVLTDHGLQLAAGDFIRITVTVWDHITSMDAYATGKTTTAALVGTDGAVQRSSLVYVGVDTGW